MSAICQNNQFGNENLLRWPMKYISVLRWHILAECGYSLIFNYKIYWTYLTKHAYESYKWEFFYDQPIFPPLRGA